MEKNKKKYWKGIEQLTNDPEFVKYNQKEFPEYLPINGGKQEGSGSSRRDFLKLMGFSVAAASLAACETPVRKAIPYLNKPVSVDPGIPNYYASTFIDGGDYCSIVVKTREGRPIKIQGNKLSKVSGGGTNPRVEASVLSLYDQQRLTDPYIGNEKVTWEDLDNQIKTALSGLSSKGEKVVLVANTILSPTTLKAVNEFTAKYQNVEFIQYDAISSNGLLKANKVNFGSRVIPSYHFDKANVIVSFSADFLSTWINPIKFSSDFAKNRKLYGKNTDMSRLYVFESNLSLTGANADYRIPVRASREGLLVATLLSELSKKAGLTPINTANVDELPAIQKAANDLWKNRGKSLVVSGSNDEYVQMVVNEINNILNNYGKTIDIDTPCYFRKGDEDQMNAFVDAVKAGNVGGVIFYNCNPVYDHPRGGELAEALAKVELKVSTSDRKDETTALAEYIAPSNHFLESWDDAEPVKGSYSLTQPTISNLFNTRQAQQSILSWTGNNISYLEYLKDNWEKSLFADQQISSDFGTFWNKALHDGVVEANKKADDESGSTAYTSTLSNALQGISSNYDASNSGAELIFYTKIAIGSGSQANNPWLQEMPDPISKACWDNYLTASQSWANANGIKMSEGRTVMAVVSIDGKEIKLPVLVQPGQAEGTFGIALGYGRVSAGKVGNNIGVNVFPLIQKHNNFFLPARFKDVEVSVTSESYSIAHTQTHHTFMSRENVVKEANLSAYQKDPKSVVDHGHIATSAALAHELGLEKGEVPPDAISLWKGHVYPNHHWAMAIDMNSCIGCGACTISCQAENNVPVVGKEEVLMRREMHWIRIDRYYSSNAEEGDFAAMEKPAENPEVTFMPMLCQQCNNAPCETVCPVVATTHSSEGLNQMTYNRCIGTRYCANNCPYKVRRFNWFKYHDNNDRFPENTSMNNTLGRMVLNPDVTVRSRGVMEKCTFCVQRIQAGKLEAKKEGRRPNDNDITPACASACPTEAIVFGDLLNKESKVVELLEFEVGEKYQQVKAPRAYNVLNEIGVKPNIWYFTKIRNKDEELA